MPVKHLLDLSDENLFPFRDLTSRAKGGDPADYFIAETRVVIQNAVQAGCRPISFLVAEKYIAGRDKELLDRFPDCMVYTAPDDVLEELTGYSLTRGILCAMARPPKKSVEELIRASSLLVVLENVQDASNVGAILRSACGLGADAVILDRSCCDPLHRKAVRTSTGAVFKIPWALSDHCGNELAHQLNLEGFRTLAMALTPNAKPISEIFPEKSPKLALFFGSEGNGLKRETITECSDAVIIPMKNGTDSLNVAASAAIAIWECAKGR